MSDRLQVDIRVSTPVVILTLAVITVEIKLTEAAAIPAALVDANADLQGVP